MTYSIDYMYLTEESREVEVDAEEGAARGSTTLERPIIVCVDRKTGGVHAHLVKCKWQRRPLDCDKNCSTQCRSWDTDDQEWS